MHPLYVQYIALCTYCTPITLLVHVHVLYIHPIMLIALCTLIQYMYMYIHPLIAITVLVHTPITPLDYYTINCLFQDILRARRMTKGIYETRFVVERVTFQ